MKGVILAGGRGTRLLPLTRATNKSLLPAGGEPLVFHPVRRLVEAGISEIMVITGPEHSGQIIAALGDGSDLGADLSYRLQAEPLGIAHAVGLARGFVDDREDAGAFVVLLGDNVFGAPIAPWVDRFRAQETGARVLYRSVPDPQRFGVVEWGQANTITRVVEKPADPPSPHAVVGAYALDAWAFRVVEGLAPSARGEMEITDVLNAYAKAGELFADEWTAGWLDAGTPESLRAADAMLWACRGA